MKLAHSHGVPVFVVNLSKRVPYAWQGLLNALSTPTSLVLVPFVPVGVWDGLKIARRIDLVMFCRPVHAGMFLNDASWYGMDLGRQFD